MASPARPHPPPDLLPQKPAWRAGCLGQRRSSYARAPGGSAGNLPTPGESAPEFHAPGAPAAGPRTGSAPEGRSREEQRLEVLAPALGSQDSGPEVRFRAEGRWADQLPISRLQLPAAVLEVAGRSLQH